MIVTDDLSDQVKTDEEPRMEKRLFDLDSGLSPTMQERIQTMKDYCEKKRCPKSLIIKLEKNCCRNSL
ncbi:hypothetical protein Q8A67_005664 [Cirrhinus molitorella]|uniref:Uncharacterized protein n=1 Tax=Cirrhinus molitorella TaxID=172907 RepID=A0AA88Q7H3_9TELE|nr:hypothetical protein Q8A67_005664 [Cirrhinus molitorella]